MAPAIGRAIPIWIRNTFAPDHPCTLICAHPTSELLGQGHHHHRERGAGEHRRRRHDRRARHRAPPVRRAARGRHLGDPDLAGQLRAFHLLRDSGRARPSAPSAWCARRSRASWPRDRSRASKPPTGSPSSRWWATAWPARRASSAKVFDALGKAGVNVRAIAQGASERNISVVVDGTAGHAGTARHACQLLPLAQHAVDRRDRARAPWGACCSTSSPASRRAWRASSSWTCACAASWPARGMLLSDRGVELARWKERVRGGRGALGPGALRRARAGGLPAAHRDHRLHGRRVGGRCTTATGWRPASTWSRRTRRPTAPAWSTTSRCKAARRAGGSHYLYEGTVGAGLPVIQTLRDLRETGDEINSIEGIFSGHAGLPVQCLRRQRAVLGHRARGQAARLHGAGSARRPVRHRRGAQAHHPGARDGPAAGARRRAGGEPGAARSGWRLHRRVPGRPDAVTMQPCCSVTRQAKAAGKVLRFVGRITADGRGHGRAWWSWTPSTPSPTSRSPTTWCASPPHATTTIR